MNTTRSVKINFEGDSRDVALQLPATLGGLQAAVISTFSADLPPRSEGGTAEYDLRFTYKDVEGDDIVFDKDSELCLALRLCSKLEITAITRAKHEERALDVSENDDDPDKIYRVATRNLRQHHGVPHMTPDKLIKTLSLLKMGPRRLVCKGLAPRKLLPAAMKDPRVPLGDEENDEDFGETVCAEMEMMTMEEEEKKMVSGGDVEADDHAATVEEKMVQQQHEPKMPLHAALLAADIMLPPNEVRPFLVALGVRPRRFVKLGLIDAKDLPRGRHGCGPHDGKRCGRGGCCGGGRGGCCGGGRVLQEGGCGGRCLDRKPCLGSSRGGAGVSLPSSTDA